MSYVNCPRCRLTVRLRFDALAPEYCPRCERRHGVQERVFLSPEPSRLLNMPDVGASAPAAVAPTVAPPV
jgi:hypothetical protein